MVIDIVKLSEVICTNIVNKKQSTGHSVSEEKA